MHTRVQSRQITQVLGKAEVRQLLVEQHTAALEETTGWVTNGLLSEILSSFCPSRMPKVKHMLLVSEKDDERYCVLPQLETHEALKTKPKGEKPSPTTPSSACV